MPRTCEGWPSTREEAEERRYFGSDWHDRTEAFVSSWCAAPTGGGWQCCRAPGFGPDHLYCRQHAKMIMEESK